MTPYAKWISFYTMLRKDVVRIFRIWPQTLLPSVVTSSLYFAIFGSVLGSRIGQMQGVDYMEFVVPGLVMLSVVTSSYANTSFSFFSSKFFSRSIDEILVSPTPPWLLISGFVAGGMVRGVLVGAMVLITSLFFTSLHVPITSVPEILSFALLTSLIFSLAGLVNGIYAKSIDGINIVPTFVLTPLVYLGGVFYSIQTLPHVVQVLSHFNPVFYLINGFRYGFLGLSDVSLGTAYAVLLGLSVLLVGINWYLLKKGLGLKQ